MRVGDFDIEDDKPEKKPDKKPAPKAKKPTPPPPPKPREETCPYCRGGECLGSCRD